MLESSKENGDLRKEPERDLGDRGGQIEKVMDSAGLGISDDHEPSWTSRIHSWWLIHRIGRFCACEGVKTPVGMRAKGKRRKPVLKSKLRKDSKGRMFPPGMLNVPSQWLLPSMRQHTTFPGRSSPAVSGNRPMKIKHSFVQFAWLQPKVLMWLGHTHRRSSFVWPR